MKKEKNMKKLITNSFNVVLLTLVMLTSCKKDENPFPKSKKSPSFSECYIQQEAINKSIDKIKKLEDSLKNSHDRSRIYNAIYAEKNILKILQKEKKDMGC